MTVPPESVTSFRAGRPGDAHSIRSLLLLSNLSAPSVGDLERLTHSLIGEIRTFVCEKDRYVLGVLQWRNLGEEVEILDLAVHPNHRRHGHACFLLQNFLSYAAQSAVQKIVLEVRESNAAAIALYKKVGFEISGRRPGYYRNPAEAALLMNLSLSA